MFSVLNIFQRLALDNIGWSRTERKSCFPMSLMSSSTSRDRNKIHMAEYGDGRSTSSRDALSAIAMRFIDEYFSLFAAWTIFRHIYFCHERTAMTSEISENTIFVRFYFTRCYQMLTFVSIGRADWPISKWNALLMSNWELLAAKLTLI